MEELLRDEALLDKEIVQAEQERDAEEKKVAEMYQVYRNLGRQVCHEGGETNYKRRHFYSFSILTMRSARCVHARTTSKSI